MESELDCTLSVTSTPVPTSEYSSGSGTTRVRIASIIQKKLRQNQDRSGPNVSLADRIKHFRENMYFSKENSRRTSTSHAPPDLHSLVNEYRDVLSHESQLSAAVLHSISDAKLTNQQVNTAYSQSPSSVSNRRVLQGSVGSEGLSTSFPDIGNVSRRRIIQENNWSRNHIRSPSIYSPQLGGRRGRHSGRYGTDSSQSHGRNADYDFKTYVTSLPGSTNGTFLPAVIGPGAAQSINRSTKDDRIFPTIASSNRVNDKSQIQSTVGGSLKPLTKSLDSLPADYQRIQDNETHKHNSMISGTRYTTYPEVNCQTGSTETLEDGHSITTGPSSCTQSASTVASQKSRTAGGRRMQGNRYIETIQKDFTKRKYQSPSFLLNHLLDVADDGYEKVLSEFARPPNKSVATQTPCTDKEAETHPITELPKHDQNMNEHKQDTETGIVKDNENQNVPSHASVAEPIPLVSITPLRKRRHVSSNSHNRTYSFINVSLNRSLSLPNMTKCSKWNTDHIRKNHRGVDIETLLHGINGPMRTRKAMLGGVTFPPISRRNKAYHRSKDALPITRTNLASRRMYLRSNSCGDIVKTADKLMETTAPPRLIGLYKDLVSLGCFSTDEDILKMTLNIRDYQMIDVKITWRSIAKGDFLNLYRDQVVISDKFKYNMARHASKQRKEFIYLEDVPVRHIHATSKSNQDTLKFMHIPDHKQAAGRMPPINKANRKCVPKRMCKALYDQTRHYFVPWK